MNGKRNGRGRTFSKERGIGNVNRTNVRAGKQYRNKDGNNNSTITTTGTGGINGNGSSEENGSRGVVGGIDSTDNDDGGTETSVVGDSGNTESNNGLDGTDTGQLGGSVGDSNGRDRDSRRIEREQRRAERTERSTDIIEQLTRRSQTDKQTTGDHAGNQEHIVIAVADEKEAKGTGARRKGSAKVEVKATSPKKSDVDQKANNIKATYKIADAVANITFGAMNREYPVGILEMEDERAQSIAHNLSLVQKDAPEMFEKVNDFIEKWLPQISLYSILAIDTKEKAVKLRDAFRESDPARNHSIYPKVDGESQPDDRKTGEGFTRNVTPFNTSGNEGITH